MKYAFTILAVFIFSSCQKVISVDLNRTNPQIVIEGVLTDQPGPDTVFVSETGNYFGPSLSYPQIDGANVVVAGDRETFDTLSEARPGVYVANPGIIARTGTTYTLTVRANGKLYQALSSVPVKVPIDTVYTQKLVEPDGDHGYYVHVVFQDPPEPGNYYCVHLFTNREPEDSVTGQRYILTDDKITNGNLVNFQIRAGRNNVKPGDTLTVELLSIDKSTYDYYNTLNDIIQTDNSPTSLSPANPTTNLTNGALGYFAAYRVDRRRILLR